MGEMFFEASNQPLNCSVSLNDECVIIHSELTEISIPFGELIFTFISSREINFSYKNLFFIIKSTDESFSWLWSLARKKKAKKRGKSLLYAGVCIALVAAFLLLNPFFVRSLPQGFFQFFLSDKKLNKQYPLLEICEIPTPIIDEIFARINIGNQAGFNVNVASLGVFNAFAFPMNSILVSRELLNVMKNDDELVALLLHELGHLQLEHYKSSFLNNLILETFANLFGSSVVSSDKGVEFIKLLVWSKQSRDAELQADQYAVEYLQKSEYSLQGTINLFRLMRELQTDSSTERFLWWLQSHPVIEDRIKLIEREMAKNNNHQMKYLHPPVLIDAIKSSCDS